MELTYHQAIINFREDLTDPKSLSYPLASVVTADALGIRWVALAVRKKLPDAVESDAFTKILLGRMPTLLQRQVDEVCTRQPTLALPEFVKVLALAMRNTIHIGQLGEPKTITIGDEPTAVSTTLVGLATSTLLAAPPIVPVPPIVELVPAPEIDEDLGIHAWKFAA